jgi:hypothetical protein
MNIYCMNSPANADIRKKAKKGIDHADDTTVKMILAMLEVQQGAEETEFEKEMLHRFKEYEQGKINPITLHELEEGARNAHKKRMKSA